MAASRHHFAGHSNHWEGDAPPVTAPCRRCPSGVSITLETGETVEPIALADDDPDNHLLVCLDTDTPAALVHVDASLFEDPGHDPNPDTQIQLP